MIAIYSNLNLTHAHIYIYIYYNITTHNFIYCKSILLFFRRVFMLRWWNQPRLRAHGLEPGRAAVGGDGEEPQNRGAGDHQRHAQCASGAVTIFFLGSCFDSKWGCLNYKTHRIHVWSCMLYMVTFTINIPQMLAYIPYMDPMGEITSIINGSDGRMVLFSFNVWIKHSAWQRFLTF